MIKKSVFIFIFFAFLFKTAFSVEQLEHDKKFYISPKGNLYIYKSSLNLTLSDHANELELILLKNILKNASFNFKTEGKNTIFSPISSKTGYAHTKQDKNAIFTIYADWSVPSIKVMKPKGKSILKNGRRYYKDRFTYSAQINDRYSGVDARYISVDDSDYSEYKTPQTFTAEKDYDILIYALDHVGNVSKPVLSKYGIDRTAPVTSFLALFFQYENVLSPQSRVALKSVDELVGVDKVFYQIDKGKTRLYEKAFALGNLSEGNHIIKYFAVDRLGNKETIKEYAFYYDKTPPTEKIEVKGDHYVTAQKEYISERSRIAISSIDNKVPVKSLQYFINKGEWKEYSIAFPISNNLTNQTVSYHAHDAVGNESKVKKQPYILDKVSPSIALTFNGEHYYSRGINFINPNTILKLQFKDSLSGMQRYNLNLDDAIDTKDLNITFDTFGEHIIKAHAQDNVNNETTKSFDVFVDNINPKGDIEFSFGKLNDDAASVNSYPKKVVLYLSATDEHSGIKYIKYSINKGETQNYKNPIRIDQSGEYSIAIQIHDNVGNITFLNQSFRVE